MWAQILLYGFLVGLITRVIQVLSYHYSAQVAAPYA